MCQQCEINAKHLSALQTIYKQAKLPAAAQAHIQPTLESLQLLKIDASNNHESQAGEYKRKLQALALILLDNIDKPKYQSLQQKNTDEIISHLQNSNKSKGKRKKAKKNTVVIASDEDNQEEAKAQDKSGQVSKDKQDKPADNAQEKYKSLVDRAQKLIKNVGFHPNKQMLCNCWIDGLYKCHNNQIDQVKKTFNNIKLIFNKYRLQPTDLLAELIETETTLDTLEKEIARLQNKITSFKDEIFPSTSNTEELKSHLQRSQQQLQKNLEEFLPCFSKIDFLQTKNERKSDTDLRVFINSLEETINLLFAARKKYFADLPDKAKEILLGHLQMDKGMVSLPGFGKITGTKERALNEEIVKAIQQGFTNTPLPAKISEAQLKERISTNYELAAILNTSKIKEASTYNGLKIQREENHAAIIALRASLQEKINDCALPQTQESLAKVVPEKIVYTLLLRNKLKTLPQDYLGKEKLEKEIAKLEKLLLAEQINLNKYSDRDLKGKISAIEDDPKNNDLNIRIQKIVEDQQATLLKLQSIQGNITTYTKDYDDLVKEISDLYIREKSNISRTLNVYLKYISAAKTFCDELLTAGLEADSYNSLLKQFEDTETKLSSINDNIVKDTDDKLELQYLINCIDNVKQTLDLDFIKLKQHAKDLSGLKTTIEEQQKNPIKDIHLSKNNPYYSALSLHKEIIETNISNGNKHLRKHDNTIITNLSRWFINAARITKSINLSLQVYAEKCQNAQTLEERLNSKPYLTSLEILQNISTEFNRIIDIHFPKEKQNRQYDITAKTQNMGSLTLKSIDFRLEKLHTIYHIFKDVNNQYINQDVALLNDNEYVSKLKTSVKEQLTNTHMKDIPQNVRFSFMQWIDVHILKPLQLFISWFNFGLFPPSPEVELKELGNDMISKLNEHHEEGCTLD